MGSLIGVCRLIAVACVSCLCACSDAETSPPAQVAATKMPAGPTELTLSAATEGDPLRPEVAGRTNLPDGTALLVNVSREDTAFFAQDSATVDGGHFKVGPFSNRGAPLVAGTYEISISAGIVRVQPESIRSKLGENYQNYTGPQFKESDLGRSISIETSHTVPGTVVESVIRSERAQTDQQRNEEIKSAAADFCATLFSNQPSELRDCVAAATKK